MSRKCGKTSGREIITDVEGHREERIPGALEKGF